MARPKGMERMLELIGALRSAMARMEEKQLGADELDRAVEDARSLYERLVVLRHKAREAALAVPNEPAAPVVEEAAPATDGPIRLDTRPPEISPHQTSIIDAIAENEAGTPQPSLAEKPRPAKAKVKKEPVATVADKLEHAPVADLHKAIALSQKFWFIAELFGGRRDLYEQTINAINGMANAKEAEAHLRREVLDKLDKPPGEDVLATFMDLLKRRFP